MSTKEAKKDIEWHLLDAKDQVIGRLATKAASLLLAKHRPQARAHTVAPVNVVVVNTDQARVTGTKEDDKIYHRYTGYPGGLRQRTLHQQRQLDSRRLFADAVSGMLPKNKLRSQRLSQLRLYKGSKHPHEAQITI